MNKQLILMMLLGISPATSFAQKTAHSTMYMKAGDAKSLPLIFRTDADVNSYNIPDAPIRWGMDVAWNSSDNVTRGTNFIGKDVLSIGRVSFQPSDLVDADGNLSEEQKKTLDSRLRNIAISGIKDIVLNCDHEVLCNKDNFPNADTNYRNYNNKPQEWYRVIKATVLYCRAKGFNVVTISPFNEPDYTSWKEGTKTNFKDIARLITEDEDLKGIRISAGNTLNCDQALSWYNAVKPYVTEGNTHQLAGGMSTYNAFWQTVRKDGNHATADELHNVMEAFVGAHYGMQSGIWWGWDGESRGEYCQASHYGKEIAYAENSGAWSAASLYKWTDNKAGYPREKTAAFLGTSERQATTSSYDVVATDRPVYYESYGPTYILNMELPGGTGYSTGQTNADRVLPIYYGEDVPLEYINPSTQYVIKNVSAKKCIGYSGGGSGNGTELAAGTYSTSAAAHQQWYISPVSSRVGGDFSYVYIKSVNTGQYMDVMNFSTSNGGQIIAYAGNGGAQEQWTMEFAGNNSYYIRSRHSGLYLGISASGKVVQQTFNGNDEQKWTLLPSNGALNTTSVPSVPADFTAMTLTGSVKLTWKKNSTIQGASYLIYRSSDETPEQWDVIARMLTDNEFVDNDVKPGVRYAYKIKAINRARNLSNASEAVYATVDTEGLVAHYTFDETSDDATDNINDLSFAGKPAYSTSQQKIGSASLTLNGTDTYALLPSGIGKLRQFTFATWINGGSTTQWGRIFDLGNDQNHYVFLTPNNGSEMRFVAKNGGSEQILSTSKPGLGWHHVAVTVSEEEVIIYVDGVEKASTTDITIRPADFCPVKNYIGRSQYAADPLLKASLDDLRFYNYPLSAEQINQLFNGEEPSGINTIKNEQYKGSHKVYDLSGKRISSNAGGIVISNGKKHLKN